MSGGHRRARRCAVRYRASILTGAVAHTGQERPRREILPVEEAVVRAHGRVGGIEGVVAPHEAGLAAGAAGPPVARRCSLDTGIVQGNPLLEARLARGTDIEQVVLRVRVLGGLDVVLNRWENHAGFLIRVPINLFIFLGEN